MSAYPYRSSAQPGVFHNHDCCPQGARIPVLDRDPFILGAVQCSVCRVLDDLLGPRLRQASARRPA